MGKQFEAFLSQGEEILIQGGVRDIDFAGATYQVEVFDHTLGESFWPLLHFDLSSQQLKEALCSCAAMEEGCPHVAAAYLRILQTPQRTPLHTYFPTSFFCVLFQRLVEHVGYEENILACSKEGHYVIGVPPLFEVEGITEQARTKLIQLVEERQAQTPENSIQFSELAAQEIAWWKEGRPSAQLRFSLSVFSDLAKWALILQLERPCHVEYRTGKSGLPHEWILRWETLRIRTHLSKDDLLAVIPTLDTITTPLKVYKQTTGPIENIIYCSERQELKILHANRPKIEPATTLALGKWLYQPDDGFYSTESDQFLDQSVISKSDIGMALEQHLDILHQFLPIHVQARSVQYTLQLKAFGPLEIRAFLLEPGDLEQEGAWIVHPQWAYLPAQGFVAIEGFLFEHPLHLVSRDHISEFVNRHRIWLSHQRGFEAHLASFDTWFTYTVDDHKLQFHTKLQDLGEGENFGDWIYYPGQGFFPKTQPQGHALYPGLVLNKNQISSFIKLNQAELENVPGFFCPNLPLKSRGLKILHQGRCLQLLPVYTLQESYVSCMPQFYGDFVYLPEHGFHLLPPQMRLPLEYQEECQISTTALHGFLSEEYPKLVSFVQEFDPRLHAPHQAEVQLRYLVRTPKGGLKAEFVLVTEHGEMSVTRLLEEARHQGSVLVTDIGCIDLRDERFSWMRTCKSLDTEQNTCELSTLDFLRLDTLVEFRVPPANTPQLDITRMVLKELREFLVSHPPNLKGLKSELRLYQQTGLQWLWFLYRNGLSGLLCDDMGLGKTHQAMGLMSAIENHRGREPSCFLVVSPTSVIYHWQDKLQKFLPHLPVHTFHGSKRTLPELQEGGVLLTSYGMLRLYKEELQKFQFDLAVYDEIQVAKNPHSQIHEALKSISTRMSVGLTGTPIENNLRELKSLLDLVLPGYMPSEARFRDLFVLPIERDQDEEKKALLQRMVKPFTLRRCKRDVLDDLPEKTEDLAYCGLSKEQGELYTQTLTQHREAVMLQLQDQTQNIPYMHIFSLLTRLKQICNHPALVHKDPHNYQKYTSGKWDLFVELIGGARESGHKVVVFSQYLHMLDIIEAYVKHQGWGYAQIRGDTLDREGELRRFAEDPACTIFIGSLQAAGLGIDLTAANVVILYDRWWNAARENQAIDRVHRIGQKWAVSVFKLIAKGTLEEKIDRMIYKKKRLMEEIIAVDDQAILKKLTRSELIELLSYSEENITEDPI